MSGHFDPRPKERQANEVVIAANCQPTNLTPAPLLENRKERGVVFYVCGSRGGVQAAAKTGPPELTPGYFLRPLRGF